jgi:hypothetical protein
MMINLGLNKPKVNVSMVLMAISSAGLAPWKNFNNPYQRNIIPML